MRQRTASAVNARARQ